MNKKNQPAKNSFYSSLSPLVFLLPIASVLAIYLPNAHRLSAGLFLYSLTSFLVLFLFFVFCLRVIFNNKYKADIVAACVYIGFFFPNALAGYFSILWPVMFLVVPIIITFRESLIKPIKFGIYFIVANSLIQSSLNIGNVLPVFNRGDLAREFNSGIANLPVVKKPEVQRDVYYIVLDRYARADQLKSVYGFDNSQFIDALELHGMQVADEAYSNYQRTAHSLASSLNLSYLPPVASEAHYDWLPLYNKLKGGRVFHFFKKHDYEFYNMGSWWEVTRINKLADVEINYRAWPELIRVIFEGSVFGKIASMRESEIVDPRKLQCIRAQKKFAELQQLPSKSNKDVPKFVFAHFLVPHPPYVIDRNGVCVDIKTAKSRTREQNYTEQIMYANKQILKFLKQVQLAKGIKPIVVLQADEGPWPKKFARDEIVYLGRDVSAVDWSKVNKEDLTEKMAILNAVYFPDRPNLKFPANSSPVNNFRFVLNEYFSTKLPIMENKSYIFPNNNDLYRFHDVTDKLK